MLLQCSGGSLKKAKKKVVIGLVVFLNGSIVVVVIALDIPFSTIPIPPFHHVVHMQVLSISFIIHHFSSSYDVGNGLLTIHRWRQPIPSFPFFFFSLPTILPFHIFLFLTSACFPVSLS